MRIPLRMLIRFFFKIDEWNIISLLRHDFSNKSKLPVLRSTIIAIISRYECTTKCREQTQLIIRIQIPKQL